VYDSSEEVHVCDVCIETKPSMSIVTVITARGESPVSLSFTLVERYLDREEIVSVMTSIVSQDGVYEVIVVRGGDFTVASATALLDGTCSLVLRSPLHDAVRYIRIR
jgi:hypothetical protein